MKYSIDHSVEPSTYLWLDNLLVEKNLGFQSYSGSFRVTPSLVSGYNSYSAPHRQFVYDYSVSGASVPSGVSVGGAFVSTDAGVKIDFYRGQVLFTGSVSPTVSAAYSYKEINVYFTTSSESQVLFENKFVLNPRSQPKQENFNAKDLVYPCVFIKSSAGENKTLCFDSCSSTVIPVRLIVLAENLYQYRAITSALRDQKEGFMAIFNPDELPFDELYALKSPFDYSARVTSIQTDCNRLAFIKDVSISDFQDKINTEIGPRVFGGFVDLDLELIRFPRL